MSAPDYEPQPARPVRKRRRGCRLYLLLSLLLFTVIAAAAAAFMMRWERTLRDSGISSLAPDPDLHVVQRLYLQNYLASHSEELRRPAGGAGETTVDIAGGTTADRVVDDLVQAGLLNNRVLFLNYLRYYGLDSGLQTGQFTLEGNLTIPQLAAAISDGFGRNLTVSFLPGMRMEEMVQLLAVTMPAKIDPDEFQRLASSRQLIDSSAYPFLNSLPPGASLEGFLFPDAYVVPPDANAFYLIDQMLQNFDRQVTPAMRQAYGAQGLSLFDAVILASIIERETPTDDERPLISSVFLNRLAGGIPLQADPTVQYAAGYQQGGNSWWKVPLTAVDLEASHPYNTYVIPGLPPGPIANPGLSSLQAVAEPAATDFLFFVLDCFGDPAGRHVFSHTYEEHVAHVQKCR